MSTDNGPDGHGPDEHRGRCGGDRPIMLVRYRPGVAARVVHLVPLPTDERAGAVSAVCGTALMLEDIETLTPGVGMPCTACVATHAAAGAPPADAPDDAGGPAVGVACYQQWDWPVTLHRDQVQLSLHRDVSAVAIPIPLCTEITTVLAARRCAPAVLAHPYIPDHHILLTGERYGVALRCIRSPACCCYRLPPPRGSITWIRPPQADSLRLCREIDFFGALRTALGEVRPVSD